MSLIFLALLASAGTDELVVRRGDVEARVRVLVPDEGAGVGLARVRVLATVSGPAGLAVEGPRLEDGLAAWRATRRASSWREEGGRCVVGLSLTLEQVKPGVVPLPGLVLSVREGEASGWHELSWPDLLREPRDGPDVDRLPPLPPSPWPRRLALAALATAVALACLLAARRATRRVPRAETPEARARALLGEANVTPARAELIVRDYLDQRFGLATRRMTARETVAACAGLPEAARLAFAELTQMAELVKYAGVVAGAEERARAIGLALRVVEGSFAKAGEKASSGASEENASPG